MTDRHLARRDRVVERFQRTLAVADGQPIGIARKRTDSHVYRERVRRAGGLDLRELHEVIRVDPARGVAEVEGMTTFYDLVAATLPHGLIPKVTPELRTLTVGGTISGLGVESSSFRYGLVHETIRSVDVLTGRGEVVHATADNAHRDLFAGLPNAYGTLGYVLRAEVELVPAPRFVRLEHRSFGDLGAFFEAIARVVADEQPDFVDGVVFAEDLAVLTLGTLVDEAPYVSNYVEDGIYHLSLLERADDYLTTHDYLWRWDRDSFWSTRRSPLANPLVRKLAGRALLRSDRLFKIRKVRNPLRKLYDDLMGQRREIVIQDAGVPIDRCAEFVAWLAREVRLMPLWICPVTHVGAPDAWPLVPYPGRLSCDVGYYGTIVYDDPGLQDGHYQRAAERKLDEIGAMKALYSECYYSEARFWELHDRAAYSALKGVYDPAGVFPGLYEKCVRGR